MANLTNLSYTKIKLVNKSKYPNPEYAHEGDSGMDVRANIETPIILKPLERAVVPTGLYPQLPKGFEIQVRPRSGWAAKKGITVLNSPGTVDSNYTGEIGVILVNLSNEEVIIEPGDRIAQLVLAKVEFAIIENIEEITIETNRGGTGFGDSGVQ